MRNFKKRLFCGSGISEQQIEDLHVRLDIAFSQLSGLQQPSHWDHEPSKDEMVAEQDLIDKYELEIDDVARDILMALTGRDE